MIKLRIIEVNTDCISAISLLNTNTIILNSTFYRNCDKRKLCKQILIDIEHESIHLTLYNKKICNTSLFDRVCLEYNELRYNIQYSQDEKQLYNMINELF